MSESRWLTKHGTIVWRISGIMVIRIQGERVSVPAMKRFRVFARNEVINKNEIIRYGLDILNHIGAAICDGANLLPHCG